eukprot:CAMPEP_0179091066 /NCGR_PEP_ID=MMETSP0796-20121207/41581_1 /TAXON_ID=73915 /ORGANISM="Pyrodinium bahamense, Strain pbaha01" /LENGTH=286 /DNA_ID=CAMNT_0020788651 /DNA_START=167 /DNA_END=1029 /DNA_ORIENTATION=-
MAPSLNSGPSSCLIDNATTQRQVRVRTNLASFRSWFSSCSSSLSSSPDSDSSSTFSSNFLSSFFSSFGALLKPCNLSSFFGFSATEHGTCVTVDLWCPTPYVVWPASERNTKDFLSMLALREPDTLRGAVRGAVGRLRTLWTTRSPSEGAEARSTATEWRPTALAAQWENSWEAPVRGWGRRGTEALEALRPWASFDVGSWTAAFPSSSASSPHSPAFLDLREEDRVHAVWGDQLAGLLLPLTMVPPREHKHKLLGHDLAMENLHLVDEIAGVQPQAQSRRRDRGV